jgi:hypothetical protein
MLLLKNTFDFMVLDFSGFPGVDIDPVINNVFNELLKVSAASSCSYFFSDKFQCRNPILYFKFISVVIFFFINRTNT